MTEATHLPNRSLLQITGAETTDFLQGLITQDMERLTGGALFACLLTPQGKILFDFFLTSCDDGVLLDVASESAPALEKRLKMYKLRAKVNLTPRPDLSVLWTPPGNASTETDSALASFQDPRHDALGQRTIVSEVPATSRHAISYDSHRINLGVPEFGADFLSDEMFLLDVNYDMLNAVSYQKGCFVGQEVTSRMKRKAEARRRTVIARFNGASLAKSTPVTAGDSMLGEVLSCVDGAALLSIRLDRHEKAQTANEAILADGVTLQIAIPDYLKTT